MPHYPLGAQIPASAHAVSSSLPDMNAVIGYEENDPQVLNELKSGYPRFVVHVYIEKLREIFKKELGFEGHELALLNSDQSISRLCRHLGGGDISHGFHHEVPYVAYPGRRKYRKRAKEFLQHTGIGISSREAEQVLANLGHLKPEAAQRESRNYAYPDQLVTNAIAKHSGIHEERITLTNSGMNAFYAGFKAAESIQGEVGKSIWIQLGWLYLDTTPVINKLGKSRTEVVTICDASDLVAVKSAFHEHSGKIAGVITEAPTNPLVQTAELNAIRRLCDAEGAILLVDPTLASIANVDVTDYADIIVTSLTKYAANEGDIMMGAVMPGVLQPWTERWLADLRHYVETPFTGDLARMAVEIGSWTHYAQLINANCRKLARFLEAHRAVRRVFWAEAVTNHRRFSKVRKKGGGPGSIITIYLRRPDRMAEFYERLALAKGPSFGTRFTLCCPFMYLAHYDLVSTESGRNQLWESGIDPDLLRISVGSEPIDSIIEAFSEALDPLSA